MSQLDWLRAWLSMVLLALCLVLLLAPGTLVQSVVTSHAEIRQLLPAQQVQAAIVRAGDWRARIGPLNPGEPRSSGSLAELTQRGQQWLQLVCLRAALLWTVLPWFIAIGIAALLDGWIARRIRQASFRPSNALIHRLALIGLKVASLGLLSYLLIPLPWPMLVLPSLLLAVLLSLRFLLAETQKRL